MRLVVDASVLVGDLLRVSGRARLSDDRLELFIAEQTSSEVRHELPRRVNALVERRGLAASEGEELVTACLATIDANIVVVDAAVLAPLEQEARARVPRDPDDWPLVAAALALAAGIWTADNDLLGSGVPTWTTTSLVAWLERNPTGRSGPTTRQRRPPMTRDPS